MAFVVFVVTAAFGSVVSPVRASSPLALPIPPGQTWYVCQGYDGRITHQGTPALDLSIVRESVGSEGCLAGTKYTSAGSVVSSPAAGTAYRTLGFAGADFVCVNFDSGGSAAIGHLDNRIASGTRVQTGARIGTVAWPEYSNGDYSHVHIQVHPAPDCTEGSDPVAFDTAHGFKFACTPELPYTGVANEYSGLGLSRCKSAGSKEPADRFMEMASDLADAEEEQAWPDEPDAELRSWFKRAATGSVRMMMSMLQGLKHNT